MDQPPGELTVLLRRWCDGDPTALDELTPLVYHELRPLAGSHLRRERPGHTLQPTAQRTAERLERGREPCS